MNKLTFSNRFLALLSVLTTVAVTALLLPLAGSVALSEVTPIIEENPGDITGMFLLFEASIFLMAAFLIVLVPVVTRVTYRLARRIIKSLPRKSDKAFIIIGSLAPAVFLWVGLFVADLISGVFFHPSGADFLIFSIFSNAMYAVAVFLSLALSHLILTIVLRLIRKLAK